MQIVYSLPVVAIVGRPNVGKSTLFNRLIQQRRAIVADMPGVTRDRVYADCQWQGRNFHLMDTGGMDPYDSDVLRSDVFEQAMTGIKEADVLVFLVDVREGMHPLDEEVATLLRGQDKPVILAVNKCDNVDLEQDRFQFYGFGLGDPVPVSAVHGSNTGELLDAIVEALPEPVGDESSPAETCIAIVGRPNVGKSSLTNEILGHPRSVVHDMSGTTRDNVDTVFSWEEESVRLIDTAGMRRKARVDNDVEYYSTLRAKNALGRADVAILVVDATEGAVIQDQRIAGEIHEIGLPCVVLVNKWDLIKGAKTYQEDQQRREEFAAKLLSDFDFMSYVPVLFTSAVTGDDVEEILPFCFAVLEQARRKIPTGLLNRLFQELFSLRPPPSYKGRVLKLLYAYQPSTEPPKIVLKVNDPGLLHFSYQRYLENQFREAFGFQGTPVKFKFVKG